MFGPPPIPGEGPGGRGTRQRPSDRHSGSDAVPADIRIGSATLFANYGWMKFYCKVQYQMTKWTVIMSHCRIFYSQNTPRTRYTNIVTMESGSTIMKILACSKPQLIFR